ncbi:MAG: hypothetical protein H5T97_00365 [Firmicutes bacterium]|nr:hypothetical protein [Bacillota bacterium]
MNWRWLVVLGLALVAGMALLPRALATSPAPGSAEDPLVARSYVDRWVKWEVMELQRNQVLEGKAGAMVVVRRGPAVTRDPTGNGIPDLTAGGDLFDAQSVPLNHLLLIPRSDGRGIVARGPVWVMYRGEIVVR